MENAHDTNYETIRPQFDAIDCHLLCFQIQVSELHHRIPCSLLVILNQYLQNLIVGASSQSNLEGVE